MSRPVEVIALADVEISELLQSNIYGARNRQVFCLPYCFEDCQTGRVDGLGNAVHGVCCWVTSSELRTVLDIVEPAHTIVSSHLARQC